jgi:hypothetical protein
LGWRQRDLPYAVREADKSTLIIPTIPKGWADLGPNPLLAESCQPENRRTDISIKIPWFLKTKGFQVYFPFEAQKDTCLITDTSSLSKVGISKKLFMCSS